MNARETAEVLGMASETPSGWRCRCPAHDDHDASLTIVDTPDLRRIATCTKGCRPDRVVDAIKAVLNHAEWVGEYEAFESVYWRG